MPRRRLRLCCVAVALLTLAACGPPHTMESAVPAAPAETAAPDLARGELLSLACQACHTLGAGGAHQIGPNLHGVFGRRAGTQPGFDYSPALSAADLVWTPAAVEAWLADPAGFIAGNQMTFTGYQSADDRRDLVAFLVRATEQAVPE